MPRMQATVDSLHAGLDHNKGRDPGKPQNKLCCREKHQATGFSSRLSSLVSWMDSSASSDSTPLMAR